MSCEELHAILHLVLQAGNIMNAVSLQVMFISDKSSKKTNTNKCRCSSLDTFQPL